MKALFVIVNEEDKMDILLEKMAKAGLYGGTIIESQGLVSNLANSNNHFAASFLQMLNPGRPLNKTLIMVLRDETLKTATNCVEEALGDINRDNSGVWFTMNVHECGGLNHLE